MNQKEPYVISVKSILVIIVVLVAIAMIAAIFSAQYSVKKYIVKNSQNSNIVQTVQTNDKYQTFSNVVTSEKGNVVGILNSTKEVVQQGVVLTSDGLFITPLNNVISQSPEVILSDGNVVTSVLIRTYPEKKMSFYKINRGFATTHFSTSEKVSVGTEGILLGVKGKRTNLVAFPEIISGLNIAAIKGEPIISERTATLSSRPDNNFIGAALYNIQSELMGVFIGHDENNILPIGEIDLLLQDLLKHPNGQNVEIMNGLVGDWIEYVSGQKKNIGFEISTVGSGSVFDVAGLRISDIIVSVNNRFFPSVELWATFLESARSEKVVTLGVLREGETIKIPTTVIIQNGKK